MTASDHPTPAAALSLEPALRFIGRWHVPGFVALAIAMLVIVGPQVSVTGQAQAPTALDLNVGANPDGLTATGDYSQDVNGFLVGPGGRAEVSVPVDVANPRGGRVLLRVWSYGSAGADTTVRIRGTSGSLRTLGRPDYWAPKQFDVTDAAGNGGTIRVSASAVSNTTIPALFFDRLEVAQQPKSALITSDALPTGLLVLALVLGLLAVTGKLRHWPLAALLGGTCALAWRDLLQTTSGPQPRDAALTTAAAQNTSWFGLHDGLLSGAWTNVSSLAVQLSQLWQPLAGDAPIAARSAAIFTLLAALAVLYALGHRAAGRVGSVVAPLVLLALVPVRDAAAAGRPLPALLLAGAVFLYALHAALARATPLAAVMLGGAAAVVYLAEPIWAPGAIVAVAMVLLARRGPIKESLQALGIALGVTLAVLAPHLVSTADQRDGRPLAAITDRVIAARNAEFQPGERGAPTLAQRQTDALAGRRVTLPGYLFSDHSVGDVASGTWRGAKDEFDAYSGRAGLAGTLAFIAFIVGVLYTLLIPRLRLLPLLGLLPGIPTLFIAGATGQDPLIGGAALWPAFAVCAAIAAYAAVQLRESIADARQRPDTTDPAA